MIQQYDSKVAYDIYYYCMKSIMHS